MNLLIVRTDGLYCAGLIYFSANISSRTVMEVVAAAIDNKASFLVIG